MSRWITGAVAVVTALAITIAQCMLTRSTDFLQGTLLFFLYYGIVLLGVPLILPRKRFRKNETYRPFVTVLVPARNEECVIETTVRSLAALNYRKNNKPHFEIVVVDDCSMDRTFELLQSLTSDIPVLRAYQRSPEVAGTGKSAVLNEGLRYCRGEIVAVFDADSRVEPDFLKMAVPYLYDPKVGGVQGRVRMYNANTNTLTRLQEEEFGVLNHLQQISKDIMGGLTGLGGNGQLTKRAALEAVGGWNERSTTEDFDLTMRMSLANWEIRYCPEAVVSQESVETLPALMRQRTRWAEGLLKCMFDYTVELTTGTQSVMRKLDGLLSLLRIALPLWVLLGYLLGIVTLFKPLYFAVSIPAMTFPISSILFFLVMGVGILRESRCHVFAAAYRVIGYWLFNLIWVASVPVAMVKCLAHSRGVFWDKTFHKGHLPITARAVVDVGLSSAEVVQ